MALVPETQTPLSDSLDESCKKEKKEKETGIDWIERQGKRREKTMEKKNSR